MRRLRLVVEPSEAPLTLEELLMGRGALTADELRQAMEAGAVTLNRRRVRDARRPLRSRDEVLVHLAARGAPARRTVLEPARLIHLDEHLIAVDKPPGLPAQGTALDEGAGLDAAVRALLESRGEANTFVGLVHRLDLETSGVTVFGRTPAAAQRLTEAFRTRDVDKRYLALVAGAPDWTEQLVDAPLGPDRSRPGRQRITPGGRPARTLFHVEAASSAPGTAFARLEARPETGRTHQIRVHAASLGLALLGDRTYGGPSFLTGADGTRVSFPRVALHAEALRLPHPAGGRVELRAPWPADLRQVESALRAAAERIA